jgi:hypothetical protein
LVICWVPVRYCDMILHWIWYTNTTHNSSDHLRSLLNSLSGYSDFVPLSALLPAISGGISGHAAWWHVTQMDHVILLNMSAHCSCSLGRLQVGCFSLHLSSFPRIRLGVLSLFPIALYSMMPWSSECTGTHRCNRCTNQHSEQVMIIYMEGSQQLSVRGLALGPISRHRCVHVLNSIMRSPVALWFI